MCAEPTRSIRGISWQEPTRLTPLRPRGDAQTTVRANGTARAVEPNGALGARTAEDQDTSPTYAIRRRGLQAEIQQVVKRYIIDHRFQPGDPLPGEGELARQIGISRPSLREAMKVLQTIGAIETRHGSGTYVGSFSLEPLAEGLAFHIGVAAQQDDRVPEEVLDLILMREAIESRLIRRVAGRHDAGEIAEMRELNADLTEASIPGAFRQLDLELHLAFYAPLDSRISAEFVRCFWKISNLAAYPFEERHRGRILAEHDALIDALADGDPDAAATAMERHITGMSDAVTRGYDSAHLRDNAVIPRMDAN